MLFCRFCWCFSRVPFQSLIIQLISPFNSHKRRQSAPESTHHGGGQHSDYHRLCVQFDRAILCRLGRVHQPNMALAVESATRHWWDESGCNSNNIPAECFGRGKNMKERCDPKNRAVFFEKSVTGISKRLCRSLDQKNPRFLNFLRITKKYCPISSMANFKYIEQKSADNFFYTKR